MYVHLYIFQTCVVNVDEENITLLHYAEESTNVSNTPKRVRNQNEVRYKMLINILVLVSR